jgi:PilZ domain
MCAWESDNGRQHAGELVRRAGDRYVLRCEDGRRAPGEGIAVYATVDRVVYTLSGQATGVAADDEVFLTLCGVRRKSQRRTAPRIASSDLVLICGDEDLDARLLDLGRDGFAFLHDRGMEVGTQIEAILNFGSMVIPSTGVVRNAKPLHGGGFRIGCSFLVVSDTHRGLIASEATRAPIDPRLGGFGHYQGGSRWWRLTG